MSHSTSVQNLSLLYGDKLVPYRGQVYDYHIKLGRPIGLRRLINPQLHFYADQKQPYKPIPKEQGFATLEWGMNLVIAENEMQHVILHSAVLAKDDNAIIFPAPPGSGKSTLTAYLAFKGWRLMSDEMSIIEPNTTSVVPFVRPICLKNTSISLAKSWFPEGRFSTVASNTHKGNVCHLSPPHMSWQQSTRNANVKAVVFPTYKQGSDLEITVLDQREGFLALAKNAFNLGMNGEMGFSTCVHLIENCDLFSITYGDVESLREFLESDVLG